MTNELQMSLLALGGAVVAGVFAYGKWQEMQHRKRVEEALRGVKGDADVLLEEGRPWTAVEPDLAPEPGSKKRKPQHAPAPFEERREPSLGEPDVDASSKPAFLSAAALDGEFEFEAESAAGDEALKNLSEQGDGLLDPPMSPDLLSSGVDAIVAFDLAEAELACTVIAAQQEILMQIEKPVLWVALNEEEGAWEKARSDGCYRRWRVGLQLADRAGPVGGNDFLLFTRALQRLAGDLQTILKNVPASQQVLEQAQQLDRFCVDMDLQIGINLICREQPFPGTKIRGLAESAGMTLGADGLFVRADEAGRVLFALSNSETERGFVAETIKGLTTRRLVFLLDVPRAPQGRLAFKQMVATAKSFAKTLNGILQDDNGRPLSDDQLQRIGEDYVAKTQATLEAAGLTAGGPLALRLFS